MTTALILYDFVKRVVAAFIDIIHGKDESSDTVQIKAGGEYAQIGAIGYNAEIPDFLRQLAEARAEVKA